MAFSGEKLTVERGHHLIGRVEIVGIVQDPTDSSVYLLLRLLFECMQAVQVSVPVSLGGTGEELKVGDNVAFDEKKIPYKKGQHVEIVDEGNGPTVYIRNNGKKGGRT